MEELIIVMLLGVFFLLLFQIFYGARYFYIFGMEWLNNEKSSWNPNYDRMTLVMYIIPCIASFFLIKEIYNYKEDNYLTLILYIFYVILVTFLVVLVVKNAKKERKIAMNKVKEVAIKNKSIPMVSESQAKYLYASFRKYNFIDDDLEEDDFVTKFLKEPLVLNLQVPACREMYNQMIDKLSA